MDKRDYYFPDITPKPEEVSKQLKINADAIIKEVSNHIDNELKRFARELQSIKNENHYG